MRARSNRLVGCILLIGSLVWPRFAAAQRPLEVKLESFDADPAWEGFRNRLLPPRPQTVRQDFGYRTTSHAGGERAGEIGGFVQRAPIAAVYATPIAQRGFEQPLRASGKFAGRAFNPRPISPIRYRYPCCRLARCRPGARWSTAGVC